MSGERDWLARLQPSLWGAVGSGLVSLRRQQQLRSLPCLGGGIQNTESEGTLAQTSGPPERKYHHNRQRATGERGRART